MRAGSSAGAEAWRPGEDHGLPPSFAYGIDAVVALRFSTRKVSAAIGLRSPGESGDKDLLSGRSCFAPGRLSGFADAAGLQPGRSAASGLGAVSIAILPDGLARLSALAATKVREGMGFVSADLGNQAGSRAGLFCTRSRRQGMKFTPAIENVKGPGPRPRSCS